MLSSYAARYLSNYRHLTPLPCWRVQHHMHVTGRAAQVSECFERAALPLTPREEKQKLLSFVICGGYAFLCTRPPQPHVLIMPWSPCHQHLYQPPQFDVVAVIGGGLDSCLSHRSGPTGVEVAAELHDMIQEDLRKIYPDLMQDVTIRLIELQVSVTAWLPVLGPALTRPAIGDLACMSAKL